MKNGGYEEAARLIADLTIEQKVALLSGKDFWTTKAIGDIPSITMTDGPHGVRLSQTGLEGEPATCFPTASALAATWNPELAHKVGEAIGIEAQSLNVQVVLGPGVNMKRSPLGGRNFEYLSEDPYLTAEMAIAYIKGMQSQGVGTSLKHFAANNQEYERMRSSSDVDERTLHEIYLRAFELTVKEAQPWSLMASYNLINGTRATESGWLLQDLLRDQWGHEGIVVSDWMAAAIGRPAVVKAGTHLEMPGGSPETTKDIMAALEDGSLSVEDIDTRAIQLVANIIKVARLARPGVTYDVDEHHALAKTVATEAITLLKNDALLPIEPGTIKKLAVVGYFAKHPRFQGGGSSQITPTKVDTLLAALQNIYGQDVEMYYAEGFRADGSTSAHLLDNALRAAKAADVTIVAAGLPSEWEFEGVDRPTLELPAGINKVIDTIASSGAETVVTLTNGSAVALPWLDKASAVIEGWLTGQAGASAMAEVIAGVVTPSGRLSETFPLRIEDTPPYPDFPNKTGHARYSEGVFIGYRWYSTRNIAPQFAFGYGLSYTTFEYSNLKVSSEKPFDDEVMTVSCTVTNTGKRNGKEVVQLYIANHDQSEVHPERELKKFAKVALDPGESKEVVFELSAKDFAFYSLPRHAWATVAGSYSIIVARSAQDADLETTITMQARHPEVAAITHQSLLKELAAHPRGRKIYELMASQMARAVGGDDAKKYAENTDTLLTLVGDLPIGRLPAISGGLMPRSFIDGIITYCRHDKGFHPLESFAYYKEVAALIVRAVTQRKP